MENSYTQLGKFSLGEFQKVVIQKIVWEGKEFLDIRRFKAPMVFEEDQRAIPTKAGIRFLLQYLPELIDVLVGIQEKLEKEDKKDGFAGKENSSAENA